MILTLLIKTHDSKSRSQEEDMKQKMHNHALSELPFTNLLMLIL